MCKRECIGDYYKKCNHWHMAYETGELVDCKQPRCRTSSNHIHKDQPTTCDCFPEIPYDYREGESKVRNMFHTSCPKCDTSYSERGRKH